MELAYDANMVTPDYVYFTYIVAHSDRSIRPWSNLPDVDRVAKLRAAYSRIKMVTVLIFSYERSR
jgi:hypothetical protein